MDIENVPWMDDKTLESKVVDSEVVKYIREQRHDFMNHIQVIWGYLQLKKPDEALIYISQINKEFEVISCLFKLGNPTLSLFLYNQIKKAHKSGLYVDFEPEIESTDSFLFHNNQDELNDLNELFDEVIRKTTNSQEKVIYLDVFDDNNVLYLVVSNNCYEDYSDMGEDNIEETLTGFENVVNNLREHGIRVFFNTNNDYITIRVGFNYKEA